MIIKTIQLEKKWIHLNFFFLKRINFIFLKKYCVKTKKFNFPKKFIFNLLFIQCFFTSFSYLIFLQNDSFFFYLLNYEFFFFKKKSFLKFFMKL